MKKVFTFIIFSLWSILNSQTPSFHAKKVILETNAEDWFDIFLPYDLNNDQKFDFVGSEPDGQILYMSDGDEFTKTNINTWKGHLPVSFKDFDNDGLVDILTEYQQFYKKSNLNEFTAVEIEAGSFIDQFRGYSDFDGDGMVDIVSTESYSFENDNLIIYFKDSAVGFVKIVIADEYDGYGYIKLIDFNNDNKMDIVVTQGDDVLFFANNGDRTFEKVVLETNLDISGYCLNMADLDNDGDLDLIVDEKGLYIFENDGNSYIEKVKISNNTYKVNEFFKVGDLDNDGDIDIVSIIVWNNNGPKINVSYHLNKGNFDFAYPKFLGSVTGYHAIGIPNYNQFENWFSLVDMNSDMLLDIVLNAPIDKSIVWFENRTVLPTLITLQPTSVEVCETNSFIINVNATGSNLTYQWQKDGVDINGAIENTHIITNTLLTDVGVYSCVVTGDGGIVTSEPATLTVKELIDIQTQPIGNTKVEGDNITFEIIANGDINTYQWYKYNVQLSNDNNITGAQSSTLTVSNLTKSDDGIYTCKISGDCNELTSEAATLTVYAQTIITGQPSSLTSCEETSVTFTTVATGDNLTYQWTKDGNDISEATTDTYTINSAATSDAGEYKCEVTGDGGSKITEGATLAVDRIIHITTQPLSQDINQGTEVKFNVIAEGTIDNYQWYKDNNELSDGGNISGSTTSELTITNVISTDEGNYSVKIIGTCGDETSETVVLTVLSAVLDLEKAGISIVPNPTSDYINIINTGEKIDKIEIYNNHGQVVIKRSNNFDRINVSDLVGGLYYIKVIQGTSIGVGKIVVE